MWSCGSWAVRKVADGHGVGINGGGMGNLTAQAEAWAYSLTHNPPTLWQSLSVLEKCGIFVVVLVLWSFSWWLLQNRGKIKGRISYEEDN